MEFLKLNVMKYKKRRFVPGECMHVYQRSVGGFNIFYDLEDYLVFYTIFSIVAKQYNVSVMELCIMLDHVHILLSSMHLDEISALIRHYTSMFVREYNMDVGRKGALFHKSYGSAPKRGGKSIRTTIVYIGNNPVEKGICCDAEQYYWNFLRFYNEASSDRIPVRRLSRKLQALFREVTELREKSAYLGYSRLRRMFKKLDEMEKQLLINHIVREYFPFDIQSLLSYYESYDDMLHAMHSTSGAEYDIKEHYSPESNRVYDDMAKVVRASFCEAGCGAQVRKVTMLPEEEKFMMAQKLQKYTSASVRQIEKFLNMSFRKVRSGGMQIGEDETDKRCFV